MKRIIHNMPLEFKWKLSFILHNVALDSAIAFDGFQVSTHPESTKESPKVTVIHRFTTSNFSSALPERAREDVERFLDASTANTTLTGWDVREIPVEFDLALENWLELQEAGMNPPAKGSFTFHNTATWSKQFVESAWEMSKQLGSLPDQEVVFRIMRLLRRSVLDEDEFERFSKVWRSFNAFYNHLATNPQSSEASRIVNFARILAATHSKWLAGVINEYWTPLVKPVQLDNYLKLVLTRANYLSIMDCLIKQNFTDRGGTNHSQDLSKAVTTNDVGLTLETALLCLYVERNQVLHGEVISDSERDLLYVCAAFLQRTVALALNELYFIPLKHPARTT
jgi:hypothetical protein